jgi:CRISPR system Cascade subunit CasA
MNKPSFDVLTEPWIPVIDVSGGVIREVGLLHCLQDAHRLKEIREPSPIVEFGLYRLLVAFVLDMLIFSGERPETSFDLKELIAIGNFDQNVIDEYLKNCGDVFDLFHPEKPFLQTKIKNKNPKPLAGLYPPVPSGTNVLHWHHKPETCLRVNAKGAARLLTTVAPFMTSGGAGLPPSINGAPPVYSLPVGKNLFETLILNIPLREQDSGTGTVEWRSDRIPGEERNQATATESLTWRPRKIQLIPEIDQNGEIFVEKMFFEKGDKTRLKWIDANVAYRFEKDNIKPLRIKENSPLWRDAGSLLLVNGYERGKGKNRSFLQRPDAVHQAFEIESSLDKLVVQTYGMRTDMKMKVFEWIRSVFSVPTKLGRSTRLGALVQRELDLADSVAWYLRIAIKNLSPNVAQKDKKTLGTIIDRSEQSYWKHLEKHFLPLMEAFSRLDPDAPDNPDLIKVTAEEWRNSVRSISSQQFEFAAKDMDSNGEALERIVFSRNWFNRNVEGVLR